MGSQRVRDDWVAFVFTFTFSHTAGRFFTIQATREAWLTIFNCIWLCRLSSVAQSCSTVCDPMNHSTPGLPVHCRLPEFTQTHVHRVGDAIQPSHPLSSPSPLAPKSLPASGSFPMSQLFAWGGQSIGVSASASVLPMNTQDWSPLGWTAWICFQSKGLSRVFSSTTVQKHEFFRAQLSSQSNSHMTTGKTIALTRWTFVGKVMSLLFNMLSRLYKLHGDKLQISLYGSKKDVSYEQTFPG